MSKKEIIKILKIYSIFIISAIALGCLLVGFISPLSKVKGVMYGITVGITIGGIIKIKYAIPNKYKNKDERDLIISLISTILSGTYFGIASFLTFMFVITSIISITIPETSYYISLLIIIGGTVLVDKIANAVLQRTY